MWDMGGSIGTSYYLGDIGGVEKVKQPGISDLQLKSTRFSLGWFIRRRISYKWAINFKANYTLISGDDKFSTGTSRARRNLSFRNNIIETSSRFEFYPIIINDLGGKKRFRSDLFLTTHIGFGIMYHNPQAKLGNKWHSLKPLKTEGANSNYSLIQPIIPIGFGIFTTFKKGNDAFRRHRLGVELDYRLTFTDYLDDISTNYIDQSEIDNDLTNDLYYRGWEIKGDDDPESRVYPEAGDKRGNPSRNDAYFTIMFSYSYILSSGKRKFNSPRYGYEYGRRRGHSRKSKF